MSPSRSVSTHVPTSICSELGVRPSHAFSPEAVVFVEGKDDRAVYQVFSARLGLGPGITFVDMEGASNVQFALDVRLAKSLHHSLDLSVIWDGDIRTDAGKVRQRDRISKRFKITEDRWLILSVNEMEGLLLDAAAIRAAFPGEIQSEEALVKLIGGFESKRDQKSILKDVISRFELPGDYDEVCTRIAQCLTPIPHEVEFFLRAIAARCDSAHVQS